MKKEDLDWRLSRHFLSFLRIELKRIKKYYGLVIVYEIEAHRLGDEAVIGKNKNKLKEMESTYIDALEFAYKSNSYKHMFSLYHWCARYFIKFGDVKNGIKYCKLAIDNAGIVLK